MTIFMKDPIETFRTEVRRWLATRTEETPRSMALKARVRRNVIYETLHDGYEPKWSTMRKIRAFMQNGG